MLKSPYQAKVFTFLIWAFLYIEMGFFSAYRSIHPHGVHHQEQLDAGHEASR